MITKKDLPKGTNVYYQILDETYGPYTVRAVRDTAILPMVSFKEIAISVGINYIKLTKNGKPGKMSDYLAKHNDSYLIKNVYEEGMNLNNRSLTQMEGIRNAANKPDLIFFRPDHEMLEWIVKYAAGRLIIDAGCGSGRLTESLADLGARICGVDPFFDTDNGSAMNMERIQYGKQMIHFLPKKLQDAPVLYKGQGNQVLLLFARPCHSKQFVEAVLELKDKDTEALYITVPGNLTKYKDLGKWDSKKKLLNPSGKSHDKEVFYSVDKPKMAKIKLHLII